MKSNDSRLPPLICLGYCALLFSLPTASLLGNEVRLELSGNRSLTGQINTINADEITLLQNGDDVVLATSEVQRIVFDSPAATSQAGLIRVRLVDGSVLLVRRLNIVDRVATLVEAGNFEFQVSVRNIDSVQFVDYQQTSLIEQWSAIVNSDQRTGDLVVIKREGNLDYLEGVVGRIDDATINFRMDDQEVDAAREKIDGIVYYHAAGRTLVDPVFQATTASGSRLMIKSAERRDPVIALETVSGETISVALDQLKEFDFTSHRFQFLSSMVPSTVEWKPLIYNARIFEYQEKLNSPRFDQSFQRTPLDLEFPVQREFGTSYELKSFDHGIAVKGGTRMVFPLQGQFARVSGVVGFSPQASHDGHVEVVILGDGRQLLRQPLKNRDHPPLPIDLEVENVNRLTISVNYHDARNVGDVVHFCNLKVTK